MLRDGNGLLIIRKSKVPKLIWRHEIAETHHDQRGVAPEVTRSQTESAEEQKRTDPCDIEGTPSPSIGILDHSYP